MSQFNLLPWREQKRALHMRSWQIGASLCVCATVSAVCYLDYLWDGWLTDYQAQQQQVQQTLSDLKAELKDSAVWQAREHQTQQVQTEWQMRQQQQGKAWHVLQQLLSVPPRGVQIERILWREQYIQLSGWALSTGHWQAWLTGLALAGFSTPVDKAQWEESSWRNTQGLAAKQHRFSMQVSLSPQTTVKP